MGTTRLAFSPQITPIKLNHTGLVEIEVPAGETHYRLQQIGSHNSEQDHREIIFHLRHPNSQIRVIGFVQARGEWTPALHIHLIHHAKNTRAETLVRTLAYDTASPSFKGLIQIDPGAQGTESYLNHHSLLLGEGAHSRSIPSLEIQADQVKCSHAATIRTITDLDLFYLRARGISAQDAQNILVEAFISDVAENPQTN